MLNKFLMIPGETSCGYVWSIVAEDPCKIYITVSGLWGFSLFSEHTRIILFIRLKVYSFILLLIG